MTKAEIVKRHCYKPISWQVGLGYTVDMDGRCRASVHDEGRSVGFHQCPNKAKVIVEGVTFCGIHAPIVRRHLERAE